MSELTKEQTDFLEQCEEEFKDRFTEKDEEFVKVKTAESKKPPIIDPWYNAPQSSKGNYSRQNHGRDRRNRDRDRDRSRSERDRDRDRYGDRDRGRNYTGRNYYYQRHRPSW